MAGSSARPVPSAGARFTEAAILWRGWCHLDTRLSRAGGLGETAVRLHSGRARPSPDAIATTLRNMTKSEHTLVGNCRHSGCELGMLLLHWKLRPSDALAGRIREHLKKKIGDPGGPV